MDTGAVVWWGVTHLQRTARPGGPRPAGATVARYDLSGRTVVITGGTGGFARALAPVLRRRGAKLALLDLDPAAADAAAAALGGSDVARGWRADVTDLPDMERVMAEVHAHYGHIDVVMANAGVGGTVDLLSSADTSRWDRMVEVNLNGVFRTFRAAVPFVEQSGGYLLATSSMGGFVHNAMQGAYTATKAGVWALCNTWRLELAPRGVAVGSLHPTFFKTPMTDELMDDPAGGRLFDDHKKLFRPVSIDVVVQRAVHAIEHRRAHTVAPRSLQFAAVAPGALQALVEFAAYRGNRVEEAAALVKPATAATGTGS